MRKARPVKQTVNGFEECCAEEATHIEIKLPGPMTDRRLPIKTGNQKREGTECWTWNGSTDAPTLRPSVLTQLERGDHAPAIVCHSFIEGGNVQFLSDCTHKYAGKMLELLEV